jgi:hypothetical protein
VADRDKYVTHRRAYLVLGDLDKPIHEPECECEGCEGWRVAKGRPTRRELNAMDAKPGGPGEGDAA